MSLLDLVRNAEGMLMVNVEDKDHNKVPLKLLPGLSVEEIVAFEAKLPCPIPIEVKELLAYTSGFEDVPLPGIDFTGGQEFIMEDVFPYGLAIAEDGYGNCWVIDLTSDSQEWGPIFYLCLDPPVIVYQAATFAEFVEDIIRHSQSSFESDLGKVHEDFSKKIWDENPQVLTFDDCRRSDDELLREFADSLDDTFLFVDLRNARLGDGFTWGRYGADTVLKRFKNERLFAYKIQKSWFQKLFGK